MKWVLYNYHLMCEKIEHLESVLDAWSVRSLSSFERVINALHCTFIVNTGSVNRL